MKTPSSRSARTAGLIIRLRHFLRSRTPPLKAPQFHKILNSQYLHPLDEVSLGTINKLCYGDAPLLDAQRPKGNIKSELFAAIQEYLVENSNPTKPKKTKS